MISTKLSVDLVKMQNFIFMCLYDHHDDAKSENYSKQIDEKG